MTAAFRASDGPEAFRAALEDRGYLLARGDRRDYVIIDRKGGIHSLARRIDGMKAAELREFMGGLGTDAVPNIEHAREIVAERERRAREPKEVARREPRRGRLFGKRRLCKPDAGGANRRPRRLRTTPDDTSQPGTDKSASSLEQAGEISDARRRLRPPGRREQSERPHARPYRG